MSSSEFVMVDLSHLHPAAREERAHTLSYLALIQRSFADDLVAMRAGQPNDATAKRMTEVELETCMDICEAVARQIAEGTHTNVHPRVVKIPETGTKQ